MRSVRSGLVAFTFVMAAVLSWAQSSTTSLSGTVQDSSGAVVAGAGFIPHNKKKGFYATTQSGTRGLYEFVQITPGTYEISARAASFGVQIKVAQLLVNQPATVVFVLSVQA